MKVSSVTEKRIIWDLAKAGWVDSDDESEDGQAALDEDDEPEGLLKQAEALIKASRATLVRTQHPAITLVLPRISASPDSKDVANIMDKIRNLGVTVRTSEDLPTESLPLAGAIMNMVAERFATFSDVLNIDCTILLAFASDLSHGRVDSEHWHNKAISRQIEMEVEDQLLVSSLWPACGARKLVCSREAASRMQEIVETIGTETEKKRASLILGLNEHSHLNREELVHEFQKLTDYTVPAWVLPIEVVEVDLSTILSKLPPIAEKVSQKLTSINQSVFLYGWANNLTTLSSNGSVAKMIEVVVEQNRTDEKTVGPDVWLSPSSRSLVGKEKQRRGYTEKEMSEEAARNVDTEL